MLRIAERAEQLIPADPGARMRAIQWLVAALNSVEPFVMAIAVNDIFEADRDWSKARHPKVVEDLHGRLQYLEAALGDNEWIDGGTFTVGDLMLISVLGGLRGSGQLDRFLKLAAYVERGEARPGHRKAMADQLALYADPTPA